MPENIDRSISRFLGNALTWVTQNPGTALVIFVLVFVGLTIGFALKNANK